MEADKQEKIDNELIAEFMGLQFVRVGYIGDDDPEDGESQWQKDNQDWFDKHYEFHDNSVGNYAVNIKDDLIFWQDDLKYDTSWDCLMPVCLKLGLQTVSTDIKTTYKNVIDRILEANKGL